MPANPDLEKIHIYNLPVGTKAKLRKVSKKQKAKSLNTFMVDKLIKLTK